jgi:hypothetical protein
MSLEQINVVGKQGRVKEILENDASYNPPGIWPARAQPDTTDLGVMVARRLRLRNSWVTVRTDKGRLPERYFAIS